MTLIRSVRLGFFSDGARVGPHSILSGNLVLTSCQNNDGNPMENQEVRWQINLRDEVQVQHGFFPAPTPPGGQTRTTARGLLS
jgi:hypothetical protein